MFIFPRRIISKFTHVFPSDISYTLTKYFNWYNCFYVHAKYQDSLVQQGLIVKCRENRNSDRNTNESNFICKTSARREVNWIEFRNCFSEKKKIERYTRDKKLFYHLDPCITVHPVYNQCVLDRKITKKKKKWKKMKILTCTRKLSSLTPNLI